MRQFVFYGTCTVLLLVCLWLVKLAITGISQDFGYGFAAGGGMIVVLGLIAEKLGLKEPRY